MALVVLVIGNAALLTYLFVLRPEPTDPYVRSTSAAAPTTPAAEPTADAPPVAESPEAPPVLAVYGDGYTTGSSLGGQGAQGWPALVAQRLGADLRQAAVSMAGYAAVGVTGETFPDLVAANPVPDADVVIVFGSRNDTGSSLAAVERSATETLATLRANSPEAQLLVIGPAWSNASPPADLDDLSDAVERAATAVGAAYVDPLTEGWFAESATLIADDGISPTDDGHAYLADQITPLVESALTTLAQPSA
ncbi:SGNH/GDSL hydrolase family protein [Blastococcus mobilis]|uniref:SGNH/GDSL hydrolase family protein n=1 Tax=Blastococcus mobilis TaxID=1938746 RepID=UPI0015953DAB|nr:SGNH/GDSL hydrolase family protein [Blastococcus mobilis]